MKTITLFVCLLFALTCRAQTVTITSPCNNWFPTTQANCPYGLITATTNVVITSNFKSASITKVGAVDSAVVITWTTNGSTSTVSIPKGSVKGTRMEFSNINFLPYINELNVATHHDSVSIQVIY